MSLGLFLGAATVGYRTSLAGLALMGSITGLVLGAAQALALPHTTHRRWVWPAAMPALWAIGWTSTTLGGSTSINSSPCSAPTGRWRSRLCPACCCRSSSRSAAELATLAAEQDDASAKLILDVAHPPVR